MATKTTRRAARRSASSAKAQAEAAKNVDIAEDEDAAAEAAAAEELKKKQDAVRDDIIAASAHLHDVEKTGALAVREAWLEIGDKLLEGRALFPSTKEFGKWVGGMGLDTVSNNSGRSNAMWLASIRRDNPGLFAMFPETRSSPQRIRQWYRDELAAVAEVSKPGILEDHGELAAPEDAEAQLEQRGIIGDELEKLVDAAPDDETRGRYTDLQALVEHSSPEEVAKAYAKYKPKTAPRKFAELEIDEAVTYIVDRLATHDDAWDIYEKVKDALDAALNAAETASEDEEDELDEDEAEDEEDTSEMAAE